MEKIYKQIEEAKTKEKPNGFKYKIINKPIRVKIYLKGTNQYTILYR